MRFRTRIPWLGVLVLALLLLPALPLTAQTPCDSFAGRLDDIGSREQLKQYVRCAAAHVEDVGWEQAAQDFESSAWLDDGLYLFADIIEDHTLFVAGNEQMTGTNQWDLQDSDGHYLVRDLERIALDYGEGYGYYRFENRVTGREEPKVSFVKLLERDDGLVVIGAGIYPQDTQGTCSPDAVRASLVYTEQDVERFVNCAAHHLQQNGLPGLFELTSDPRWNSGPTYLFMIDMETLVSVAHGGNPDLVGTYRGDLVDADGVQIVKEFQRVLDSHDDGYVYYSRRNPATDQAEPKISYVRRVRFNGRDYQLGAGLYVAAPECRSLPSANDIDTREELQLFVHCARLLVDERGELAFDLFLNHPHWLDDSIYVFVTGADCRNIVYQLDYLEEEDSCDDVDAAGNFVSRDIRDMVASEAGEGWVDYVWLNPNSETVEPKSSWVIGTELNGERVAVGAGLYESEMQQ